MPPPTVIAFAPGRVELLCNYTDYNDGVALAAAMDRGVSMGAEKLDADLLEVSSETNGREVSASLKELQRLDEEGRLAGRISRFSGGVRGEASELLKCCVLDYRS